MFSYNADRYDFWEIYDTIIKYYPIGISSDLPILYNQHKGIIQAKKVIEENICDEITLKNKWTNFTETIALQPGQEMIGHTFPIVPAYSSFIRMSKNVNADQVRFKELFFFISLLAPVYSIISIDRNEIIIDSLTDRHLPSTNYIVVSPEGDYRDLFLQVAERIEDNFKTYRFLPFFIYNQQIEGTKLEYRGGNAPAIFHLLFNHYIDLNTTLCGNIMYGENQWRTEQSYASAGWKSESRL